MKHIFSLYYPSIQKTSLNTILSIDEKSPLFHRIVYVLRLQKGETCILFNGVDCVATVEIGEISKKKVDCLIKKIDSPLQVPKKTFFLPIVDREYRDKMIYACAAQQINITFVKYAQSQCIYDIKKEYDRCTKIAISACEQARQFIIPTINNSIISFDQMIDHIKQHNEMLLYFDENENNVSHLISKKNIFNSVTCGPEAGLSKREKTVLKQYNSNCIGINAGPFISRSCAIIEYATILIQSL